MCLGCASYKGAGDYVKKHLSFYFASEEEKDRLIAEHNGDPEKHFYCIHTNYHRFEDYPDAKINVMLAFGCSGFKGITAQFNAIKLMTLYEEWCFHNDQERYQHYQELLLDHCKEWKTYDRQRMQNSIRDECGLWKDSPTYKNHPDQYDTMVEMTKKNMNDQFRELYGEDLYFQEAPVQPFQSLSGRDQLGRV